MRRGPLPGGPPLLVLLLPRALEQFQLLAVSLAQRHAGAELWQLGPEPSDGVDSTLTLDLGAARDLRPVWERMEALGIESGRLGSERRL